MSPDHSSDSAACLALCYARARMSASDPVKGFPGSANAANSPRVALTSGSCFPHGMLRPHHDLVIALLRPDAVRPGDGRLVHLIHRHNELGHAQGLGQQCVLPRLPAALEACLELALRARGSD